MRDPLHIVKSVRLTEKATALSEKHNQYVLAVEAQRDQAGDQARRQGPLPEDRRARQHHAASPASKSGASAATRWGSGSDWKKAIVTLKAGEKIELV